MKRSSINLLLVFSCWGEYNGGYYARLAVLKHLNVSHLLYPVLQSFQSCEAEVVYLNMSFEFGEVWTRNKGGTVGCDLFGFGGFLVF